MRFPAPIVVACLLSAGCTTTSLERHTLRQDKSLTDFHYQQVLENLAMIAECPDTLPAYSLIFAGSPLVTDINQLVAGVEWANVPPALSKGVPPVILGNSSGFAGAQATGSALRTISANWAIDPIIAPETLLAIRCACRWVLFGPESACVDSMGLLDAPPREAPAAFPYERHFGAAEHLARLPEGWLHVGCFKDVPRHACYKAHSGKTWVWVTPDGMEGLSRFTLIVQDIARVRINDPSLFYRPLVRSVAVVPGNPQGPLSYRQDENGTDLYTPYFANATDSVQVWSFRVDAHNDNLGLPENFFRARYDNLGANAGTKSLITAR